MATSNQKTLATSLKGVAEYTVLAYVGVVAIRGLVEMGTDLADFLKTRKRP